MATRSAQIAGLLAGAAGVGVLIDAALPSINRALSGITIASLSLSPSPLPSSTPYTITAGVTSRSGGIVGVQGTIIQGTNNLVGGHLWSSSAVGESVYNAYINAYNSAISSGQTPGQASSTAEAAVAANTANFAKRIATASASSGQAASITLYGEPLQSGSYIFLVTAAANPSALIVQDPIGTSYATLKRASVAMQALSVSVS